MPIGTILILGHSANNVRTAGSIGMGKTLIYVTTMDFKPSVSVLFGHYSLPWRRILTKLGRTKFEKTT